MTGLRPDMAIWQRIEVIAAALAKVLDREIGMEVGPDGPGCTDLSVWVITDFHSETVIGHSLNKLARELELLL